MREKQQPISWHCRLVYAFPTQCEDMVFLRHQTRCIEHRHETGVTAGHAILASFEALECWLRIALLFFRKRRTLQILSRRHSMVHTSTTLKCSPTSASCNRTHSGKYNRIVLHPVCRSSRGKLNRRRWKENYQRLPEDLRPDSRKSRRGQIGRKMKRENGHEQWK